MCMQYLYLHLHFAAARLLSLYELGIQLILWSEEICCSCDILEGFRLYVLWSCFACSCAEKCPSIDSELAHFNPSHDQFTCSDNLTSASELARDGISCVFSCGNGYELGKRDENFLTCANGAWIGNAPTCEESSAFSWHSTWCGKPKSYIFSPPRFQRGWLYMYKQIERISYRVPMKVVA